MSKVTFYKMQANGNDFILFTASQMSVPVSPARIRALCARHFGVGADGLIVLEPGGETSFKFHYYNADGSRGEMCANGARCALWLARELGWIEKDVWLSFEADDGRHQGRVNDSSVEVEILSDAQIEEPQASLFKLPPQVRRLYFLNTGVPHAVLWLNQPVAAFDLAATGPYLRYHPYFKPRGVNVDIFYIEDGKIEMRTYERGVEEETLSCGTGVSAVGLIFIKMIEPSATAVDINMPGGSFRFKKRDGSLWLQGPAGIVYQGRITL